MDLHIHVKRMALLLQDVRFRLPLPHQQLPSLCAPKPEPFSSGVDAGCGDSFVGDAQRVNVVKVRHLVPLQPYDDVINIVHVSTYNKLACYRLERALTTECLVPPVVSGLGWSTTISDLLI